jgi:hypothetical protein
LGFVVQLDFVTVGILADVGWAVAEVAVIPANFEPRTLQRCDAALKRLRAARAIGDVAESRLFRPRQLQRVALVIVVGAKINGIALASAFRHAHDLNEEAPAFFRLGREQFEMAQVGHVHDGFRLHTFPWRIGLRAHTATKTRNWKGNYT